MSGDFLSTVKLPPLAQNRLQGMTFFCNSENQFSSVPPNFRPFVQNQLQGMTFSRNSENRNHPAPINIHKCPPETPKRLVRAKILINSHSESNIGNNNNRDNKTTTATAATAKWEHRNKIGNSNNNRDNSSHRRNFRFSVPLAIRKSPR